MEMNFNIILIEPFEKFNLTESNFEIADIFSINYFQEK
jgi:hypothetical protein